MNDFRILQVTAALEEGGVERGTIEMSDYIVKKGASSYVASSGGRFAAPLVQGGGKHYRLPLHRRNPVSILYCAVRLIGIIKKNDISLVHARSRAPAWAAFLACKYTRTPFVTTFHGTHKIQNRFKKFYNSSMVRGVRVIAISNFIKQHIIDNYGIDQDLIDLAPRGFAPDVFSPKNVSELEKEQLRSSLGIAREDFVVTLPGRLTRWKGQVEFVQCLVKIADIGGWKALLVGGEGKKTAYRRELQQLIDEKGLGGRVLLVGSQKNMPLYYAISDVVVSASMEPEAFGRVAVEAQAMAKPVIATAHGGSLETVLDGETGWLVDPNRILLISDVLRKAISDRPSLMSMGAKGQCWVGEHFTVDVTCTSEWASYEKILN